MLLIIDPAEGSADGSVQTAHEKGREHVLGLSRFAD